jgi:hypothetical protein
VARLLLFKEHWYTDSTSASASSSRLTLLPSHQFDVPVTQLQRPQPVDLGGTWNVFVTAANPAVEENPDTLQVRSQLVVRVLSAPNQAASGCSGGSRGGWSRPSSCTHVGAGAACVQQC